MTRKYFAHCRHMACAGTTKGHGNFTSWPQRPASRRRGNEWKQCNQMRTSPRVWEEKTAAGRRAASEVALKIANGPLTFLSVRITGHPRCAMSSSLEEHHNAQSFSSVGDHGLDVGIAHPGKFCGQCKNNEKYRKDASRCDSSRSK